MTAPATWVVIPALDEERSLPLVLADLPAREGQQVVVCDNGSTDATAQVAREAGAIVVSEPRRGYGQACLSALAAIRGRGPGERDIVVFLDADYSDDPTELPRLLAPLERDEADLVIGSRVRGNREPGALLPHQRWGNALAGVCIRLATGVRFSDLGPFRAIRWGPLESLGMQDRAFGWTVEMQLKAAGAGWRCVEVPVSYRKRVGESKISGTVRGSLLASATILGILGRWLLRRVRPGRQ